MIAFGPLFQHELTRLARRGLQPKLRAAFAGLLLVALLVTYVKAFPGVPPAAVLTHPGEPLTIDQAANFAERFFVAFLVVQLLVVSVVTPVVAAGAITEERDRGSFDFLLSSPLTSTEIVLGKLAARVAFMVGVLLTGLPILVLTMFFGGVDGPQLLAGYAITLVSVVSVGAYSLRLAVEGRALGGVLARVYLLQFGLAVFGICGACCVAPAYVSPFAALFVLVAGWPGFMSPNVPVDVGWFLAAYAGFHLLAAALWVRTAVSRVRTPAVPGGDPWPPTTYNPPRDGDLPPVRQPLLATVPPRETVSPPDGDPFAWKEAHFGPRALWSLDSPSLGGCVFAAGVSVIFFCMAIVVKRGTEAERVAQALLAVPLSAIVLGVGVLACGSVARERQAGTLVSLLTLPVGRAEILRAKARRAVTAWWPAYIAAVPALFLGMCAIRMFPAAVLTLPLALAGWVAFAVGVGVWLSVRSPSPARATGSLVGVLLGLSIFPPLLSPLFGGAEYFVDGLSPVVGLWHAVPMASDWRAAGGRALGAVGGAGVAAVAGWWCWRSARRRFETIGE